MPENELNLIRKAVRIPLIKDRKKIEYMPHIVEFITKTTRQDEKSVEYISRKFDVENNIVITTGMIIHMLKENISYERIAESTHVKLDDVKSIDHVLKENNKETPHFTDLKKRYNEALIQEEIKIKRSYGVNRLLAGALALSLGANMYLAGIDMIYNLKKGKNVHTEIQSIQPAPGLESKISTEKQDTAKTRSIDDTTDTEKKYDRPNTAKNYDTTSAAYLSAEKKVYDQDTTAKDTEEMKERNPPQKIKEDNRYTKKPKDEGIQPAEAISITEPEFKHTPRQQQKEDNKDQTITSRYINRRLNSEITEEITENTKKEPQREKNILDRYKR